MKRHTKLACAICVSTGILSPLSSQAEVTSLSSSELTETYIKDSTIIVTPKNKKQKNSEKTSYSSLTIAPIVNNDLDLEELRRAGTHNINADFAFMLSEESLRNASISESLIPELVANIPTHAEFNSTSVAEELGDPRYTVPEGDFDFSYVGNDLGLSRTADQLTFSIGNLPGIQPIILPAGVNDGPLQIIPRADGGFDLTINIPQDN